VEKKSVLIISQFFHPEQTPRAFRATELVKELLIQGHNVSLMIPSKEGIGIFLLNNPVHYINLGELKWRIPNFDRFGKIGRIFSKVLNRVLPLFFEYPSLEIFFKVRKAIKKESRKYDLLISIAVPYTLHWAVASVWSKDKNSNIAKVWISDCGDPYCLRENDTFRPPFYFHWIEKWFMKKTDFITVPTYNSHKAYFNDFHSKMHVIPQGFKFNETQKHTILSDGIIRFGYGGSFIPGKRDPKEFIKFLTEISNNFNYEFHIFTKTPQFVEEYIKGNKNIYLHEPIDRLSLLNLFSTFDFVVNFSNSGFSQTPSKLIDYAIIRKPILNIETSCINRRNIIEFLNKDYKNQLIVDDIEIYRIENVVKKFIDLI
jgi:hypothetical protein